MLRLLWISKFCVRNPLMAEFNKKNTSKMVNYLEEIKQFGQFNSGNMLQLHVPSVFSHLKFSQEVINIIFASYLHFYAFFVQWGKNEVKKIYFHFILHFYFLLTCGLLSVFQWNTDDDFHSGGGLTAWHLYLIWNCIFSGKPSEYVRIRKTGNIRNFPSRPQY